MASLVKDLKYPICKGTVPDFSEMVDEEDDDPEYGEEELKVTKKVSKISSEKQKDPFLETETQTIPAG